MVTIGNKEPARVSQFVGAVPPERPLYPDRLIVHHGNDFDRFCLLVVNKKNSY